jgi:hypothetical protein
MESSWSSILTSVVPFVLLLALWFFLLKKIRGGTATTKKNLVDPFQEMLQTVIVPEIRALRESIDALSAEVKSRNENQDSRNAS